MGLQVSPRCFPCRCSDNADSAGQQIDSCTIAAVLRQKQAGRITGGLFFWVCLKMGVGRDPTIDPQNGHSMVTIMINHQLLRHHLFEPICFWMLTDMR